MEAEVESLIVKIASQCNLDCDYCYIYHGQDRSWESMPFRMPSAVIEGLSEAINFLHENQETSPLIAFHGGEPLLFGVAGFDAMVAKILEQTPQARMTIQSNGTIYNDRLEAILRKYRRSLTFSLSVDGFQAENDRHRVDRRGKSRFLKIKNTIERAREAAVLDAILMVVDIRNSPEHILEFMNWARAPKYDLLLPDGNHETLPPMKGHLDSKATAQWVLEFARLYCETRRPFGVRMLDDIIERVLLEKRDLSRQRARRSPGVDLTIDTDGEIKLVDTLRINRLGSDFAGGFKVSRSGIVSALRSKELGEFVRVKDDVASQCKACSYYAMCGGGYIQHRWDGITYKNPSVYCADYKRLFEAFELALS